MMRLLLPFRRHARALLLGGLGLLGGLPAGGPAPLSAQVELRDLVFTGGLALEGYRGTLSSVTLPVVDSADLVGGVVGQFSGTADLRLFSRPGKALDLRLDGGIREYATWGWSRRDFAPRETVYLADFLYRQSESWGTLSANVRPSGRWVADRPPAPVYIEPGYQRLEGSIALGLAPIRELSLDARILGELADYSVEDATPQLDLLDREMVGGELGASWGKLWTLRLYTAYQYYRFPKQGSFDPGDPVRRDGMLRGGLQWTSGSPDYYAELGMEGILNRSNSARPEYNAVSVRGLFATPLPWDVNFNAYVQLTTKHYISPGDFVLLVPGEEADNTSIVFIQGTRALSERLDAGLRLGWTRAESNVADEYFERFGLTFLLTYRPSFSRR